MTQDQSVVSLRPEDAVEGGAIPQDKNLLVKDALFVLYDYNGKAALTTAAKLDLVDDEGVETTQYYSVADPSRFAPSQDGKTLMKTGSAEHLSKSCNFIIMMTNLVNAGFPENKVGGDITLINDLYAYWIAVPQPKRGGIQQDEGAEKPKFEKVVLVVSKINRLPWEKAGKAAPKAKAAAASAPAEETGGDDDEAAANEAVALGIVAEVLKANGGSAERTDIGSVVFSGDLKAAPNRDAVAKLIFADSFKATLMANGYKIDGETISQ